MRTHLSFALLAACSSSSAMQVNPPAPDAAAGASFVADPGLEGPPFSLDDATCVRQAGYTQCTDVVYSVVGQYGAMTNYGLKLDLYAPDVARTQQVPAILYIHGGGWLAGSNHEIVGDLNEYLNDGYVVLSVEYRLTADPYPNQTGVVFPQNLQDVKTAVRWLRIKASPFVDPDRIMAYGFSAGAHLASVLATTGGIAEFEGRGDPSVPDTVKAAVGLSTPLDFHLFEPTNPALSPSCPTQPAPGPGGTPSIGVALLIGAQPDQWTEQAQNPMLDTVSAMTYLDPTDPPMLLFYGTCDQTVPYMGGEEMVALAQRVGANVTGFESPMQEHGTTLQAPGAEDALQAFIAAQLQP